MEIACHTMSGQVKVGFDVVSYWLIFSYMYKEEYMDLEKVLANYNAALGKLTEHFSGTYI